jgi:hypothetical protein
MGQHTTARERILDILSSVPLYELQHSLDQLAEAGADRDTLVQAGAALLDALSPWDVLVPGPAGLLLEAVDRIAYMALLGPVVDAALKVRARRRRLERRALLEEQVMEDERSVEGAAETRSDGPPGPEDDAFAPRWRVLRRRQLFLRGEPGRLAAALAVLRERQEGVEALDGPDLPEVPPADVEPTEGQPGPAETAAPAPAPAPNEAGAPAPA